jgi:hypothetical protein
MISDPKTTPNTRAGRILFALVVALGAGYVQFALFRSNGLLWSLATCAFAVPWLDRFFPGNCHQWSGSIAPKLGGVYETSARLDSHVSESVSILPQRF